MESVAQDLQLEAALLPKLSLEERSAAPCHGLVTGDLGSRYHGPSRTMEFLIETVGMSWSWAEMEE